MQLDLDDEQTRALLNLLIEAIEADRYPFSPRVLLLRDILVKFGEIAGGLPPDLAAKLHRYAPPSPAVPPPKVYEPPTKGRYRRR
jgi:hypothetical protein